MNNKMVIRIKKRSQPSMLIWLILLLLFAMALLLQIFHLPGAVRYLCDVVWICMAVMLVLRSRIKGGDFQCAFGWIILFAAYTLLVYMVSYQSVFYYLWGFRNNFRFYVAFLFFVVFAKAEDIHDLFRLFDQLYWVNLVVTMIQFYLLEVDGDYLGGIFGVEQGCNGYTVVFLSVIVAKSVVFYLEAKEKTWQCLTKCTAALYVAALAELKYFYIMFIVIVVLASLFTKFTWRKFFLIAGGAIGIVAGVSLLSSLFSGGLKWFSLEWFWKNAISSKGYTSNYDLNRLNAIAVINERWLTDGWQRLFGLGLGNCDTSSYAIVNTPFFEKYGDMHYSWLSYAFMYLECGWIGLLFYYGFFALVYRRAQKMEHGCDASVKTYCRIARIMAIVCVMISIYNSSLRTEAGYLVYFVLAAPFAYSRSMQKS